MNKMKNRTKKVVSFVLAAVLLLHFMPVTAAVVKETSSEMIVEEQDKERETEVEVSEEKISEDKVSEDKVPEDKVPKEEVPEVINNVETVEKIALPKFAEDKVECKFTDKNYTQTISTNPSVEGITYSLEGDNASSIASIDPETGKVTFLTAGEVTVKAHREADEGYEELNASYTLVIKKVPREGFGFPGDKKKELTYSENLTVPLDAEGSGVKPEDIIYSIKNNDNSVAELDGNILKIKGVGTVTVIASCPADDTYEEAEDSLVVKINPAFAFQQDKVTLNYKDGSCNLPKLTGGNGDGAISYQVTQGDDIITVNESAGTIGLKEGAKAGEAVITATKAADGEYPEAVAKCTVIVFAQRKLSFADGNSVNVSLGQPYRNAAIAKADDGEEFTTEIKYSVVSGSAASVKEDGTLDYKEGETGTVTIKAEIPAGNFYSEASGTFTVTIGYETVDSDSYDCDGVKGNGDWYRSEITVTPKTGYKISKSNALDGSVWEDSIKFREEGEHDYTFYLRKIDEDGKLAGITDAITTDKFWIDSENPIHHKISYNEAITVVDSIKLYYQDMVQVTLEAEDVTSGLESFIYYTEGVMEGKETKVTVPDDFSSDEHWSKQGDLIRYTFEIPAQYKGSISFIALDVAGNGANLITDGIEMLIVDNIKAGLKINYDGGEVKVLETADSVNALQAVEDYIYNSRTDVNLYYDRDAALEIQITEENFDAEDVELKVNGVPVSQLGSDVVLSDWKAAEDPESGRIVNTAVLTMKADGDYVVTLSYEDRSKNGQVTYQSEHFIIDQKAPQVKISYSKKQSVQQDGIAYFNAAMVAEISVTDGNIQMEEFITEVTAKDVEGNPIAISGKQSAWERDASNADRFTCTFTYDVNANYDFNLQCTDMVGHKTNIHESLTVDTEKPQTSAFQFGYSESILDKVIRAVTFGYYDPDVTVTITAEDTISGIDHLEWTYKRDGEASHSNVKEKEGIISRKNLTFTDNGRTAEGKIHLTASKAAQYRGHIRFRAVDMAGNISNYKTDSGRTIVVDSIEPTRSVTYSPAKQVINKTTGKTIKDFDYSSEKKNVILYYDSNVKLTFTVEEANFYKEDVIVKVNGKAEKVKNWKQEGDVWTGNITISGKGDYVVTMDYSDRSSNQMKHYTSGQITIDTDRPKISVSYMSVPVDTIDEHKYYNEAVEAQISIKEHNFRASDVEVSVKAADVGQGSVAVEDYAAYLKKAENWKTDGDINTAKITYSQDANYTFEISYTDLAMRKAAAYKEDTFTVDTKKPENLEISYSSSVLETVIDTLSFGFYNAQATVTLTADDVTSGIHEFQYSYLAANGVSGINAELLDGKITESEMEFSNNGKTATAEFNIPNEALRGDNQFNGTVQFTAVDCCQWDEEFIDTTRIVVDNIAPTAEITFDAPVKEDNGISYYNEEVTANIDVTEANFYPEDIQVSVSKDGGEASLVNVSWSEGSGDHHTGSFTLSEDGDYVVYISSEDHSANVMEEYHSNQITVDTTAPTVTVEGIKDHSANKDGQIGFTVTVEDVNFDTSTFEPNLTAQVREEDGTIHTVDMSDMGQVQRLDQGNRYVYTVTDLERDGVYKLSCPVGDLADNQVENMQVVDSGNKETQTLLFSVNRDGSAYMLDNVTSDLNGSFSKEEKNVTVTEVNVDELSSNEITLYKNDETKALVEGEDYTVEKNGSEETWHSYVYTVLKDNFKEDGVYRLALFSEDRAGNVAGNTLDTKKAEVSFGIDKTAPNLIVVNLEDGTTYPLEELNVIMQAYDNLKLSSVEVKLDGKSGASWDEAAIEEMDGTGEDYTFTVPGNETSAHSVEFVLEDLAGNRTARQIGNFYVTTNMLVRFYNNKKLFYGCIVAALAVILAPCMGFLWKRRKKETSSK